MVRAAERTYDPRALETRIASWWKEHDAYHHAKAARAHGPAHFFLDGPPYATGHIHIGTARNKVLKDVHVRQMRMRGFAVRDQPGYDMHGLPIEVKVEKELGFNGKKEIEAYGIDRFVDACRHFATEHLKMMNEEFRELGVWLDWDHPYRTLDNDYVEGAWWAIEKAHERGLLFKSERVLTWCWRCETPLANAEIEFEEREDPSAYVKFPVEGREHEFLVIWTTTPWTLPANVAIAANPKLAYVRMRVRKAGIEETLVVAEAQAEHVAKLGRYESFEVVERMPGAALEGVGYRHPFAREVPYHQTPASARNNKVILGEHVAADRTGLVHTATGHGVEDFDAGKKYGIPVFSPVGEDGRYTSAAGSLQGLRVKSKEGTSEADGVVLQTLRDHGLLLASRNEKHSYGHCWRCKNPIIFRATSQWFIDVPKIKEKMIAEVDRVTWTPAWAGSARQRDWVEHARDWCISRQRYWGIPLPIWICGHCNEQVVVGSRKELHHISDYKQQDLHRPWIDKVRVVCPRRGCGGIMKRVPDVVDVWFDSAVAAWASRPRHGDAAPEPANWICEGLDQTRGWFYSQLAAGVAAFDRVPYENVVMHGWVNDQLGKAMSKSTGGMRPKEIIGKFGADALRLALVSGAAPWEDVNFGEESVRAAQRTLNILWNVHVFATQYMAEDGYEPAPAASRAEDRWLLSRLQTTVAEVTHAFEANEFHKAAREVEQFVLEDLSRWYVRLVRERVWDERESADKRAAYHALHESLLATAKLLAPFAPFTAEALYQDLTEGKAKLTVHAEDWPVADAAQTDYDLERDMATVRAAVDAAAYARQKANMKLRWPVARLVFASDDADVRSALARFRDIIVEQANTKEIELVTGAWGELHLAAVPNKNLIGRTFRAEGPKVLAALAALDQKALREMRGAVARGEPVGVGGQTLGPEMVGFETRLPEHTSGADFAGGSVYVDTVVTSDLQAEGAARDLTRRIQEMRKLLGLDMNARIVAQLAAPAEFAALVQPRLHEVADATRATGLTFTDKPQGAMVRDWDLEGTTLTIGVRAADAEPTLTPQGLASESLTMAKREGAKATRKGIARPAKKAAKKATRKAAPKKAKKATKKPAKKAAKKAAKKSAKKRRR
ncbi:MAG: isoleucyl-tRNA synthetase [Thermoplasmata archaeon]|jgi:isoleucyl-tRNA synthetase|nr:isoleucyl-tRNA synthetase [Thermoplasmata archaeon]